MNESIPSPSVKLFYGWWIVMGCMATMTISAGFGFYSHGLILDPLHIQHGWSKGAISSAFTLFLLAAAIAGTFIGGKIDKYGPEPVFTIGALGVGLGFMLLSRIDQLWHFYAVYLIIAIGWVCTHVVPVGTVVSNWFVRKRGKAMSFAMTGMSFGGIIMVPIASRLIHYFGLAVALPIFGLMFWVVIIPVALFVMKKNPATMGLFPDGETPEKSSKKDQSQSYDTAGQTYLWSRRLAMGTVTFWYIVFAFSLANACLVTFLMHEVSFLTQFLGPIGASSAISVTSLASMGGRLIMGALVDRLDKRFAAIVCFILQGTAVFAITYFQSTAALYICVFIFGLSIGNIVMMQTLIISECFGFVSFGKVAGMAGLFISAGSAFGPLFAGLLFDVTQSYRLSFQIIGAACGLASLIILRAKPPRRSEG